MAAGNAEEVLAHVRDWPIDQLKELREQLQQMMMDRIVAQMEADGLLRKKKGRKLTSEEFREWVPAKIEGVSLSEQIISDRR